ncbi:GMP synthase [Daphnia magna]|uniref:GMP synthase n=1 Tax=Daphnia magna TaxID=35525 RepID=A0A164QAW5_9CRUS|nr:GMP synthase [Daphnia magna]
MTTFWLGRPKKKLTVGYSSRVQAIHIDNGFLRKDESEQVVEASLTFRDASTNVHGRQTLSLCRTVNPVLSALRPNLIESALHRASSRADAIKTHHNDSKMVRQLRIYGRVVEPLKELLERHPFPGPGLSIRIIYAEELFMEADFVETQVLIRLMVDYANMEAKEHALLNRIEIATSEEERHVLEELSRRHQYVATLLPIRIVGEASADDNRLDPFHFDRDSSQRIPSCQRSVVFRSLFSHDFMTGLPAIPDTHSPQEVVDKMVEAVLTVPGSFRVLYDLTAKPPWTTEWE